MIQAGKVPPIAYIFVQAEVLGFQGFAAFFAPTL